MKVLLTGASGQVGRSLSRTAPDGCTIGALTHAQLDIANRDQVREYLTTTRPSVVINAAAYTAVDRAEAESNRAYAINAEAVGTLAESCAVVNAKLVHISTDYVFNGLSVNAYEPNHATDPINAYGASKLAGEQTIVATKNLNWAIVRTSWVYAPWGHNFLLTMIRLMQERGAVSVVSDQIGAPTSALSLARFLWNTASAAKAKANGIFHYADAGVASWYDFAVAINEEALAAGVLQRAAIVKPIGTTQYPTPAKRPAMSLLATQSSIEAMSFDQPHWREALHEVITEFRKLAA